LSEEFIEAHKDRVEPYWKCIELYQKNLSKEFVERICSRPYEEL